VDVFPGNQFVMILKGGTTTFREGGKEREETSKDGDVYWLDAVTLTGTLTVPETSVLG